MASTLCRNCGHPHPAVVIAGVTKIQQACDACECTTFKFAAGANGRFGYGRVQEPPNLFSLDQMLEQQDTVLDLHKTVIAQQQQSRVLLTAEQRKGAVAQTFLNEAKATLAQLRTIAASGYSPYTHPAVVAGLGRLAGAVDSALTALEG